MVLEVDFVLASGEQHLWHMSPAVSPVWSVCPPFFAGHCALFDRLDPTSIGLPIPELREEEPLQSKKSMFGNETLVFVFNHTHSSDGYAQWGRRFRNHKITH